MLDSASPDCAGSTICSAASYSPRSISTSTCGASRNGSWAPTLSTSSGGTCESASAAASAPSRTSVYARRREDRDRGGQRRVLDRVGLPAEARQPPLDLRQQRAVEEGEADHLRLEP